MKDLRIIADEAFVNFIRSHPEINTSINDSMTKVMLDQSRIYSRIAIDFAIQYMAEQLEISKKPSKPRNRTNPDDGS